MRVTIIGPGKMGRGIATRLLSGSHSVTFVGRDRRQAEEAAADVQERATGEGTVSAVASTAEGIGESEVIILALPYQIILSLAKEIAPLVKTRVVVDISNPVNENYTGLVTDGGPSAAERIRAELPPGSRVVKAFNTTFAGTLGAGEVAGRALDIFIAGEDDGANDAVAELVRTGGMIPIVVGGLERARELESLGFLGMAVQEPLGTGFMTGWKLLIPGTAPTAQASGFPREAVVGVLDDRSAAGPLVTTLTSAGVDEPNIHLLYGEEGAERIRKDTGEGSELLALLFGYERQHARRHLRALEAGKVVAVVEVEDDELGDRVGGVLADHGAECVYYYSRWTARRLPS